MKDLHNHLGPSQSLVPAVRTATANGLGVDLRGFEGAMFTVDLGTFGGTSPTMTLQYQESDDNSTYTAIAASDLGSGAQPAQITTANDDLIIKDSYIGSKRYVRVAITAIGGTAPSLPMAGSVVRGFARHQPVA